MSRVGSRGPSRVCSRLSKGKGLNQDLDELKKNSEGGPDGKKST